MENAKIVIFEDTAAKSVLLAHVIEEAGHNVVHKASNEMEAHELADAMIAGDIEWDVTLLDHDGVDGGAVYKKLKENGVLKRIINTSSHSAEELGIEVDYDISAPGASANDIPNQIDSF